MRLGFDAKRAFHNNTGLGNYSRDTIRVMHSFFPENDYVLYDPKPKSSNGFISEQSHIEIKGPKGAMQSKMHALWRSYGIKKQLIEDRLDIYHGLSNELPVGISKINVKSVVTIHDVIFMRYPELYPKFDRILYQKKTIRACQEADKIIAISQQTADDLMHFFNVSPLKIEVVYQGCHEIFKSTKTQEQIDFVRTKYGLPQQFVLNVGRIEERKNVLHLLKAISKTKDVPLVLVGRATSYIPVVESFIIENQLQDRVTILQGIDLDDLATIYQMATLFVYPSIFEGFGIPIIESLFSGTPVVTSTGSCFSEAGGPGARYVDPYNVQELQNTILELWQSESNRLELISKSRNHLLQFENEQIANRLNTLYTHLK